MSRRVSSSPDTWPLPPFEGLSFHRVVSVPRMPGGDGGVRGPDLGAARAPLIATLISARALQAAVIVAWVRPKPHAPLEVYVGGGASIAEEPVAAQRTPEAGVTLLYPPGSRGVQVAVEVVESLLSGLEAWVRCYGVDDHLLRADNDHPVSTHHAPFEDYVEYLSGHAFAWLVVGEPLKTVDEEMDQLLNRIPVAYANRENSEDDRVRAERDRARYRELLRARALGLWNVHVLVGAADGPEVRRVSALLCGGSDLVRLPYALYPGTEIGPLATTRESVANDGMGATAPFQATAELLAALARPPEKEVPGVRLVTPPSFDVTSEVSVRMHEEAVALGYVLDGNLERAGQFLVSRDTLNRHTFVCGATGAGKSQTVRALLEELSRASIPWLVIEPAKAEYARMASRVADMGAVGQVIVIRPGDPALIPVALNPLEPEQGFPLQTHIDLVRALFLAAFEADEPFPQVLSAALTRCYQDLGWNLVLSTPSQESIRPRYPNLGDLQRTARMVVEDIGYGKEVTDNVRGFVDVRIGSLRLGTPGRFFEGGHPLSISELLEHNVVIEIENIGNDQDKAFLIGTVLIRLIEHLRVHRNNSATLRHITVVEEAHRLLKNATPGSPAAHAVELFAGLLAEIRAYGEGIVVAEQIPTKILPDVIKNTALKVVHRLPAQDDRDVVGATMNLDTAQSQYVVTLEPGTAAAFADGMDRPVLMNIELTREARNESAQGAVFDAPRTNVRSSSCGETCRNGCPCTLRQMDRASRIAEHPQFTLWIEILVVAHLLGLVPPAPHQMWRDAVCAEAARVSALDKNGTNDRRLIECAIGQCAQAAVDVRYPEIVRVFTPDDLAAHTSKLALSQLLGWLTPCRRPEYQFQAGPYRWQDVRRVLINAERDGKVVSQARLESWRARGLELTGGNPTELLADLRHQPAALCYKDTVIHGVEASSRLMKAVGDLSKKTEWKLRLEEALNFLVFGTSTHPYNWSGDYLTEPKSVTLSRAASLKKGSERSKQSKPGTRGT